MSVEQYIQVFNCSGTRIELRFIYTVIVNRIGMFRVKHNYAFIYVGKYYTVVEVY